MANTETTSAAEPKNQMHTQEESELDLDSRGSDEENAMHSKDEILSPIEKVKSMHSVNNIASVPNGGLKAWLQVLGAFMLFFNSFGIINTFGAYQTFYETGELFISSSSNLSWVGAVQAFALMFVGAFTGPVYDAGYFRHLLISGTFLIVFGHMMLSLCHEYYQVLLAQGFCIGIGAGFLFVPAVAVLSTYFTTKLTLAMGIAASGSSLGGVIYPIVFFRLQPTIGFAWATRVLGFIVLVTLLIPICVMRLRVKPAAKRALVDWTAFKEPAYVFFIIGALVAFMGVYVPFFYIQYFAISTGITSPELGFYLLAVLNAGSVFGRTIPNYYAIRTGPLNIFLPAAVVSGILVLVLISVHDLAGVIIVALFYGFFSGAFVSLPPAIFVSLTKNRGLIGTRMGMGFTIVSIGILIGTPIGGIVLGPENDFRSLWIFGGVLILAGAAIMSLTRMFEAKWKIVVKV